MKRYSSTVGYAIGQSVGFFSRLDHENACSTAQRSFVGAVRRKS